MDSGFYAACTALMSKTQALDLVANNLANVNTSGFKSERNQFSSVLANASATGSSPLNLAVNNYGVLGGTRLDLSEGSCRRPATTWISLSTVQDSSPCRQLPGACTPAVAISRLPRMDSSLLPRVMRAGIKVSLTFPVEKSKSVLMERSR